MSYGRITTETMIDIADAIRAKTGSEAQLTPAEMVTEIGSIQTGGGTDYFQYARGLDYFFYLPYSKTYQYPFEEITINAPLVTRINNFFSTGAFSSASVKPRGIKKITLNIQNISGSNIFNGATDLEEVVINAENSKNYAPQSAAFAWLKGLKKISNIIFDASGANWTFFTANHPLYFANGSSLEEIRFVPNSMTYNGTYNLNAHGHLSDESLVSIANAMSADNATKQIDLHATASAKLSTIIGTVTDGMFSVDANGITTLLDFITNVKGWTVT